MTIKSLEIILNLGHTRIPAFNRRYEAILRQCRTAMHKQFGPEEPKSNQVLEPELKDAVEQMQGFLLQHELVTSDDLPR